MSDTGRHDWNWISWAIVLVLRHLVPHFRNPNRAPLSDEIRGWVRHLNISAIGWDTAVILALLSAVTVVRYLPEPTLPKDPPARADYLVRAGLPQQAEEALLPWLQGRLDSVEAHRRYLAVHFEIPERHNGHERDDDGMRNFYLGLQSSNSGHRRDVASYALGLFSQYREEYGAALTYYGAVADQELPYLESSRGQVFLALGRADEAVRCFDREIALRHNVAGAIGGLSRAYVVKREWRSLDSLLASPATARYVPAGLVRVALLERVSIPSYLGALFRTWLVPFRLTYFILGLFCALLWFLFVRWWDLFDREPVGPCILAVLLGAVAASFVFVIGDMRAVFGRPDVTGHNPTSFSYFVFSVGLVEEVAKFLPVIVVLLVTKAINEPIDWVIYGCLSALGFSVWENYSYLSAFGLEVGVVRPFLSTPLHMAMTGAIALSIPEARHRGWWPPLAVAVGLLGVATVHGTFDFLASRRDATWGLLAFGLVVVWGEVFVVLMASAETLSPLRKKITFDHFSTYYWFIGSYVLLCGTVFLMNAALVEHEEAIHRLTDNLIPGLIAFFALRLYTRAFLKRVEQEPAHA